MDDNTEQASAGIEQRLRAVEGELKALRATSPTRALRRWTGRGLVLVAVAALALAVGVGVRWGVRAQQGSGSPAPGVMNYQGQLTDASGNPLNGNADITFRLYDVSEGGTALWTEAHTGANAVPVSSGLFSTLLGSVEPIPAEVMASSPLYLGITVGSDAEMTPRQPVSSVAYTLVANDVADGAITEPKIADGAVSGAKLAAVTRTKEMVKIGSVNMNVADDYHPATSTSNSYWSMRIPDDYVSGDLIIKQCYRDGGPAGAYYVLRFYAYLLRDGTPSSPFNGLISNLNVDISSEGGNMQRVRTLATIPASSFQAGDLIRVIISRLGDDPNDTATGGFVDDAVWVEYLGRS